MSLPQIRGMYHGDISRKQTLVDYGFRLPSALDNRPLNFDEFEGRINQVIYVSATPRPYEYEHSSQVAEQIIRPTGLLDPTIEVKPTKGQVDDLLEQIGTCISRGERCLVTTLTKRMAEQLADYLIEMGIKTHYLHSEVETLERVEILRDLRLGVYDVVVGINLLREGLDMPEVSLVAVLDADKEGFLRSTGSLIQTMGRAARNVRGKAILYADQVTRSMQAAMDETARRREKQMAWNRAQGITPTTIVRRIADIMEGARSEAGNRRGSKAPRGRAVAEPAGDYGGLNARQAAGMLKKLEAQMYKHAQNLEFEDAARVRDQIHQLREQALR